MPSHTLAPDPALPIPAGYLTVEDYVTSLLDFVCGSETLQTLCGGVHILDLLTHDSDYFTAVLPREWREWLVDVGIQDLLDLLMREDINALLVPSTPAEIKTWRSYPVPPRSFLKYISSVRNHCLNRHFEPRDNVIPRNISNVLRIGMKPKKAHEVENFAAFVDTLINDISDHSGRNISRVIDFGSGQNYLGRVLASPLYQRQVIAVESRHGNIEGARNRDIIAKLAKKMNVWRNKKTFLTTGIDNSEEVKDDYETDSNFVEAQQKARGKSSDQDISQNFGRIQYVEHRILDGHLDYVLDGIQEQEASKGIRAAELNPHNSKSDMDAMVISLHSCGNLLHHGLRSLILNENVKAVAMVGCCYNMTTERLGPPLSNLTPLRQYNKRLEECALACDPHGFPMSQRMVSHAHKGGDGIRLNITARMMAVQAPQNWTEHDSDAFFTRHFYRALLQKVFLDKGFLRSGPGEAIVVGSLKKSCYQSFVPYVRGAIDKLRTDPLWAAKVEEHLADITDNEIKSYWECHKHKRHELNIIWSLMAFSAGVMESLIVTDRWLFLSEQENVKDCWVQTVFEYSQSPRNLVVVGIKR